MVSSKALHWGAIRALMPCLLACNPGAGLVELAFFHCMIYSSSLKLETRSWLLLLLAQLLVNVELQPVGVSSGWPQNCLASEQVMTSWVTVIG